MTKQEFAAWTALLKTYYPKDNLLPTKESMQAWYAVLGDLKFEAAQVSLKRFVQGSVYPPTIADIRRLAHTDAGPTWSEAWEEVAHSISKFGSYRVSEALDSLSPLTRKAAQAIGYKEICMSENPDVIRGQFRSAYEAIAKREREVQQYSPEIRDLLASNNNKLLQ